MDARDVRGGRGAQDVRTVLRRPYARLQTPGLTRKRVQVVAEYYGHLAGGAVAARAALRGRPDEGSAGRVIGGVGGAAQYDLGHLPRGGSVAARLGGQAFQPQGDARPLPSPATVLRATPGRVATGASSHRREQPVRGGGV